MVFQQLGSGTGARSGMACLGWFGNNALCCRKQLLANTCNPFSQHKRGLTDGQIVKEMLVGEELQDQVDESPRVMRESTRPKVLKLSSLDAGSVTGSSSKNTRQETVRFGGQ